MSLKPLSPRAILFDLDGTLADSIPDLAEACARMLAELGEPARSQAEITQFVGKGVEHLVRCALMQGRSAQTETQVQKALAVFNRHYAEVNGVKSTLYAGVIESLVQLQARGIKMGCVTNKPESFTLPLLEILKIRSFFDVIVGGDTLAHKKPDPEPLWFACEKLGVPKEEVASAALMVGDSANDALAARRAGIAVLLMTYGYSEGVPLDQIDCDGLLDSLTELDERLTQ